ncbi:hypothetical protein CSKR_110978 [Clonorchis sinensis]|uniref:SH3 domain-containing protein n=1 Tax=Clonorchis sinensis TaxID=79923 RepID=A0A8T1ME83_CLOSI|nr:hypothetical protein CSKR_110978 [Clonorchis sinensis]
MVVIERDRSNLVFELEHVATFVEGRSEMDPATIMAEVVNLDSNFVVPTLCKLELSTEGIRVIRIDKNEVLENAPWHRVYSEAVLLPTDRDYERALLVFRVSLAESDIIGYENELIIFGIDSERDGRVIIDHMLSYQENAASKPLTSAINSLGSKQKMDSKTKTNASRRSSHSYPGPSNARNIYMLNRCLDDIEHFGRRLNKCVKRDSTDSKDMLLRIEPVNVKPPGRHDAVETVRKIKLALNMAQLIQAEAPEAIEKIFIRLIKCIVWLDDISQSRIIPDYEMEMIQDVVEPLLNEATIEAIKRRLNPILTEFWTKLGDAWNVSAERWPHPIATYVPQFKTTPKRNVVALSNRSQGGGTGFGVYPQVVAKYSRPRINNKEHQRLCQKIQDRGGRLCYATVRHVSSKPAEIDAYQGEVFEIVDNTEGDWWTVTNTVGETGQVPKWKLRPFYLSASMLDLRQTEQTVVNSAVPKVQSRPYVYRRSSHNRPKSEYEPWEQEKRFSFPRQSLSKSRSMGSRVNLLPSHRYGEPDETDDVHPMMLYLPSEELKRIGDSKSSVPIILVPYERHSRSKERNYSPGRGHSQTRYRTPDRSPHRNEREVSPVRRRYYPIRPGQTYRPTIKLDSPEPRRSSRRY